MDRAGIPYYLCTCGNHGTGSRMDFGSTCGMLCGSMANPMALNYANDIIPNDNPAVSYATVYPLGMFTRVIIAQLILMLFL